MSVTGIPDAKITKIRELLKFERKFVPLAIKDNYPWKRYWNVTSAGMKKNSISGKILLDFV
jgi:hypothetical protein